MASKRLFREAVWEHPFQRLPALEHGQGGLGIVARAEHVGPAARAVRLGCRGAAWPGRVAFVWPSGGAAARPGPSCRPLAAPRGAGAATGRAPASRACPFWGACCSSPEVGRLLPGYQHDLGSPWPTATPPGAPGVEGRLHHHDELGPSGTLAHSFSRSAVVVVNLHPDQMNSPCSSARLASWAARQVTAGEVYPEP